MQYETKWLPFKQTITHIQINKYSLFYFKIGDCTYAVAINTVLWLKVTRTTKKKLRVKTQEQEHAESQRNRFQTWPQIIINFVEKILAWDDFIPQHKIQRILEQEGRKNSKTLSIKDLGSKRNVVTT